jgi:hypothetical protein
VSDNEVGLCLNRELKNHVVFRVSQLRTPQKMDRMMLPYATNEIEDVVDV